MKGTTVNLEAGIEYHLETLANKLNRSKSSIISQALSEYFDRQQREQEHWQQTLEAMESAANGRVVDATEVRRWLNSWGSINEKDAPRTDK